MPRVKPQYIPQSIGNQATGRGRLSHPVPTPQFHFRGPWPSPSMRGLPLKGTASPYILLANVRANLTSALQRRSRSEFGNLSLRCRDTCKVDQVGGGENVRKRFKRVGICLLDAVVNLHTSLYPERGKVGDCDGVHIGSFLRLVERRWVENPKLVYGPRIVEMTFSAVFAPIIASEKSCFADADFKCVAPSACSWVMVAMAELAHVTAAAVVPAEAMHVLVVSSSR